MTDATDPTRLANRWRLRHHRPAVPANTVEGIFAREASTTAWREVSCAYYNHVLRHKAMGTWWAAHVEVEQFHEDEPVVSDEEPAP